MKKKFDWKASLILLLLVACAGWWLAWVQAQGPGGVRREGSIQLDGGLYSRFAAGAAIAAGEAVYLDSAGKVQKAATSGQTTTLIGIARSAAGTNDVIDVLVWGVGTCKADAAITLGDRIGAPTSTAGRVKTMVDGFTNGTGATTVVMATTNPVARPAATIVLGRALAAAASAGDPFSCFIGLQ